MFKLSTNIKVKNIEIICDFKNLKKQGLKVFRKKYFNQFVYQYGKTRVLDGYATVLKNGDYFMPKVSTNQIIKLVNFDHFLGNYILNYLLDFEQRFNTVLISTILKEYDLPQDYVLDQNNANWLVFKNFEEKADFFSTIYQKVDSSNFLQKFEDKKNIPLISLAMSWTFFNVITFFEAVDISVQIKVIEGLGIQNWNIDVFKSMLHIIRRLRNTISHNDFLIVSKFEIYKTLIKKANLKDKNFFYIYDVCLLLDIIYPTKKTLSSTLLKLVNKQKFTKPVKEKVIELLGIEIEKKETNKEEKESNGHNNVFVKNKNNNNNKYQKNKYQNKKHYNNYKNNKNKGKH